LISPETSVELSEVSADFLERNASVAKPQNFELLWIFYIFLGSNRQIITATIILDQNLTSSPISGRARMEKPEKLSIFCRLFGPMSSATDLNQSLWARSHFMDKKNF
jgi:hypothetical protein